MKNKVVRTGRPQMPASYGLQAPNDATMMTWAWVSDQLAQARNYWIATTRPDGRPHVSPVWGLWVDGTFYFGTDRHSRKGRNLAANPAVSLHLESGDDVVILEGMIAEVDEAGLIARLNESYTAKYAVDVGLTWVFALRPQTALAWKENDFPNTATRWRFEA